MFLVIVQVISEVYGNFLESIPYAKISTLETYCAFFSTPFFYPWENINVQFLRNNIRRNKENNLLRDEENYNNNCRVKKMINKIYRPN
jgi:hypothetical protein